MKSDEQLAEALQSFNSISYKWKKRPPGDGVSSRRGVLLQENGSPGGGGPPGEGSSGGKCHGLQPLSVASPAQLSQATSPRQAHRRAHLSHRARAIPGGLARPRRPMAQTLPFAEGLCLAPAEGPQHPMRCVCPRTRLGGSSGIAGPRPPLASPQPAAGPQTRIPSLLSHSTSVPQQTQI